MLRKYSSLTVGILLGKYSLYLSFKFVEKVRGNVVVGVLLIVEGFEGSDKVSGKDKDVSDEISKGRLPNLVQLD